MNNFIFLGRIFKDLELRYTKDNKAVLDLPLAISNGKDDTTFINISVFGVLAEVISKYSNKGDLVAVKGLVKNRNWQDKEGKKHYDYVFIADKVTFAGKAKKENADETIDAPKNIKSNYEETDIKITDADLPF